jgi:hypothetical protein
MEYYYYYYYFCCCYHNWLLPTDWSVTDEAVQPRRVFEWPIRVLRKSQMPVHKKACEIAKQKLDSPFSCLSVGSARGVSVVVSTRWQHLCVVNNSRGCAGRRGGSMTWNGGRISGTYRWMDIQRQWILERCWTDIVSSYAEETSLNILSVIFRKQTCVALTWCFIGSWRWILWSIFFKKKYVWK